MKKIVLIIALFIGFTATSFAQEDKQATPNQTTFSDATSLKDMTQKNVDALKSVVKLDQRTEAIVYETFRAKLKMQNSSDQSKEALDNISKGIQEKISNIIGVANFNNLKANPTVFNLLFN
jgi:hypothetical protein